MSNQNNSGPEKDNGSKSNVIEMAIAVAAVSTIAGMFATYGWHIAMLTLK